HATMTAHARMDETSSIMAPSVGRGYATGALFMTGFGAVWALGAASAVSASTMQTAVAIACVVAMTIALLVLSLALWRAAPQVHVHFPNDDPERQADERRTGRLFNLVFLAQGAAIALTIIICVSIDRTEYIPPVIAFIVGAHFLPLAALFKVRLYYATGALMMLIPLVVMIAVSETRDIGRASVWMAIPMTGSAMVLWLTAVGVLRMGRASLETKSTPRPAPRLAP
ncbi:MAG: DUF7010 family protein, partial [Thermomicrobiales bacterium]